ncbi:hypothetical protein HDU87_007087 [Geranomyces variabilis]|uniref:Galactinol synthase n=1 Tax=Geranomyces variabilis TaxID=109894 RepID=A0AAD5TFR7_9FUNG|nr:hypothetical protein HDU87_007087 [Geranomyces variabilis]
MAATYLDSPSPLDGSRKPYCWATLMTKEHLLPGLVVFADSLLKQHKSKYDLVVLATTDLSDAARSILQNINGVIIRDVEPIRPVHQAKDLAFPRFTEVWTKLRAWELEDEYERVVLVDSDMLVRKNMDEIFDGEDGREIFERADGQDWIGSSWACTCNPNKIATYPKEWIPENCGFTRQSSPTVATQPDASWPRPAHLINSGFVALKPSLTVLKDMIEEISADETGMIRNFAFPDQDYLAYKFQSRIRYLPWYYNALKKLRIVHPNMWRDEDVRNVHFILDKPWTVSPAQTKQHVDAVTHGWWWAAFDELQKQDVRNDSSGDRGTMNISQKVWEAYVEKYVTFNVKDLEY